MLFRTLFRGRSGCGASHPMAVNETVIAMLRPKPDLARLTEDPAEVQAAAHRLTFNGTTIETGTDSYRLASTRARAEEPA